MFQIFAYIKRTRKFIISTKKFYMTKNPNNINIIYNFLLQTQHKMIKKDKIIINNASKHLRNFQFTMGIYFVCKASRIHRISAVD